MKGRKLASLLLSLLILVSGCAAPASTDTPVPEAPAEPGEEAEPYVAIADAPGGYSSLRFGFESGGKEYEAFITGVRCDTDAYDEKWQKLISAVAESLSEGKAFKLTDSSDFISEYGMSFDLIDAEKQNKTIEGQSLFCWAGSASDIIEYTGWKDLAKDPSTGKPFRDEDDIFTYFTESFNDCGSFQMTALKWFFNGLNMNEDNEGFAHIKELDSGGLIREYAPECFSATVSGTSYGRDYLNEQIAERLDQGCGIAILAEIFRYDGKHDTAYGEYKSGHAVTCFGYVREKGGDVSALFIADSDNDASVLEEAEEGVDGIMSDGLTVLKEDRDNTYSMYPLVPHRTNVYSYDGGYVFYADDGTPPEGAQLYGYYDFYELDGVYDDRRLEMVVDGMTYLMPYDGASKAYSETDGTMNVIEDPDLAVYGFDVEDINFMVVTSVPAKTLIYPTVALCNYSYTEIDRSCYVIYEFDAVSGSGETVSAGGTWQLSQQGSVLGESLGYDLIDAELCLETPGTYAVTFTAKGIFTQDGKQVNEAYYTNNTSLPIYVEVTG